MTPTEWELLKMLEKDVQRIDRSLIEHRDWHAHLEKNLDNYAHQINDLERRVKGLEWLAHGDGYTDDLEQATAFLQEFIELCHTSTKVGDFDALRNRVFYWLQGGQLP